MKKVYAIVTRLFIVGAIATLTLEASAGSSCKDTFSIHKKVNSLARIANATKVRATQIKNFLKGQRPARAPFLKKEQEKYTKLTRMVEDLQSGKLKEEELAGDIIKIPKELGLRETLTHGRMIFLKGKSRKPKAILLDVSGLFYGAEKILSRTAFLKEPLDRGFDIIYPEMTQGFSAAREILNNNGKSPSKIPHEEQQALLAYYLLTAISKYNIDPIKTPIVLVGHSYGGWLANRFISNPEYHGAAELSNSHLRKLASELQQKGLLHENPMHNLIKTIIPLDAGLGSLHLVHPILAKVTNMMGGERQSPFQTISDYSLAHLMQSSLLKAHSELKEDSFGLENAIALFIGLRSENMLNAPESIPNNIRIFDIVAGNSELIPSSWHRHYSASLQRTALGPAHRSSHIINGAPHDFLHTPGIGKLIAELSTGQRKPSSPINFVDLSNGKIRVSGREDYPGDLRSDMAKALMQMQINAFYAFMRSTSENLSRSTDNYNRTIDHAFRAWETGWRSIEATTQPVQVWRQFFPKIWRKTKKEDND